MESGLTKVYCDYENINLETMTLTPVDVKRQRLLRGILLLGIVFIFLIIRLFCVAWYDTGGKFVNSGKWRGGEDEATDWREDKNIIWFVQVSDLHISYYNNPKIIDDFEKFCGDFIQKTIRPAAVFVTGNFKFIFFNINPFNLEILNLKMFPETGMGGNFCKKILRRVISNSPYNKTILK